MDTQIKKILLAYKDSIKSIREALKLAEVPDSLAEIYITNLPNFANMLPEDAISTYKQMQLMLILYLDGQGFSAREIAKRIGGSSYFIVQKVLAEYKEKPSVVSPQEVSI